MPSCSFRDYASIIIYLVIIIQLYVGLHMWNGSIKCLLLIKPQEIVKEALVLFDPFY